MHEFMPVKQLGQGAYGNVTLIEDVKTKNKYVLKDVDLSRSSSKERTSAEMEVKILSTLRHPNIVQYKWSYQTAENSLHIIMSYCDGGDLHSVIKSKRNSLFQEQQVLDYFVQITMAVEYLHDRHILHRDLKTPNILLTRNNVIKVGDFGISRILDRSGDYATTLIGTPYYMSPEIFMNVPYNYKSDIWAIGCCLYELCTLKHPFKAKDIQSLAQQIMVSEPPSVSPQYSKEVHKILKACLHKGAEKRPSARKILRHPFIRKHIVNYLKTSMQFLKEKNDGIAAEVDKNAATPTESTPPMLPSLLPSVTGTKIRSNSISRKRKKPRLQLVIDRSSENNEDDNTSPEDLNVQSDTISPDQPTMDNNKESSRLNVDRFLLSKIRSSSAPGLYRLKETGRIIVSAGSMRVGPQNNSSNDDMEMLMTAMRQTLKLADIEKDD